MIEVAEKRTISSASHLLVVAIDFIVHLEQNFPARQITICTVTDVNRSWWLIWILTLAIRGNWSIRLG